MTATLPPRWFVRSAWVAHKALLRVSRDRVGLSTPTPGGKFGFLRLHTVGRRSGRPRAVVLGYIEDGDRLVTLAMNGWDPADPAWWHNLKAHPEATVDLAGGSFRPVTAHEATGAERERLWAALHDYTGYGDLDAFAARRGRETAVVVLSPAPSRP
ncbi:nitroreductase/quinone reductase family protein [Paractinoplanes atraurantiacus]|uniref:Deazaflavin-dependent oxidoreductase, nitroreductase family n=1 Tax=Paractinoplanes atraurantiacus TaxID=1036182 RepID=A0A285ISH6_9ACTN|nr:nitroreductase/quinone reductase family protein [Actinoplanes atraurantiacus]SNY50924.1 deazaflavin-dependent oxidoreductase, nitroreductase family [Actinoplanes atraurantiacus]